MNDAVLERLWDKMDATDKTESPEGEVIITEQFHIFKDGTPVQFIWDWFDKKHSKGVDFLFSLN